MPRSEFQRQLVALSEATEILGEQASTAVQQAIQSFTTQDLVLAARVVEEDAGINRMEHQILDDAALLLTLQAPVASDLRRILGVSRVAADLERIGDHARDIARTTLRLAGAPPVDFEGDFPLMVEHVSVMLRDGLKCFVETDVTLARAVCLMDDGVDAAYAALYRVLLSEMVANSMLTARATYTLFVGHDLERIADHVTNVAETVIYIATGETVELN